MSKLPISGCTSRFIRALAPSFFTVAGAKFTKRIEHERGEIWAFQECHFRSGFLVTVKN